MITCGVCGEPIAEDAVGDIVQWCQIVDRKGGVMLHVHEDCMDPDKLLIAMWMHGGSSDE